MARDEDTYRTTIDLAPDLVSALDDALKQAMDRKLLPRSARRNDLIRLLLREGVERMQADQDESSARKR